MGLLSVINFANPLEFVCSSIQAASRLGYQDSAELCAQYLAPILDAIKFNFLPFGANQFAGAMTLPKQIAYSEPRLHPLGGYKDTTVPGIWSRDTLFSQGNHEQGWVTAPGMQGVDVQPFTANMLTRVPRRTDGRTRRADSRGTARVRGTAGRQPAWPARLV
jgi:phospholipid/cholesterol/gamma-HCH transport system substrate-binding protein